MALYFMRRDVYTIGDLIYNARKSHYILWIPIIGLILTIGFIVYESFTCIWNKIAQIRIRR